MQQIITAKLLSNGKEYEFNFSQWAAICGSKSEKAKYKFIGTNNAIATQNGAKPIPKPLPKKKRGCRSCGG